MIDLRKNLIERRWVELTPDLAKHYLTFNTYPNQRSVLLGHVNLLAHKMECGLFRFGEIALGRYENQDIMMNGQHVCNATIKYGDTIPCVLEKFRCDSKLDLSQLFRQFEIIVRSIQVMVSAEADALELIWPKWLSSLVVAAATLEVSHNLSLKSMVFDYTPRSSSSSRSQVRGISLSKDERVNLLGEYLEEGEFLYDLMTFNGLKTGTCSVQHLRRAPVALMVFYSSRVNKNDAGIFWSRVRDGENLKRNMPEMLLREFLTQVNSISERGKFSYRHATNHEYAYRCALAWNAFRENRRLSRLIYKGLQYEVPKLK